MHIDVSLEEKIGQLILVGFHGTSPEQPGVQKIFAQAETGEIGGVALFRYNIENRAQLTELTKSIKNSSSRYPLFIGLDQEGGKVQRLRTENGFRDTSSAKHVAEAFSVNEALVHYEQLGEMLKTSNFNFDWAPCVDLDGDPGCKVIGGIERSYSDNPETVVKYASAMLEGLRKHGVIGCLKHFPGHGRVAGDTHEGLVDITGTWDEIELEPYRKLIERGGVDCIMSAHLVHQEIDPDTPATLSPAWLGKLRKDLGYDGVVVSDCLHMGAMVKHYPLEEVVVRGLNAGLDILLFSNNPLAAAEAGIRHASDSGTDYVTLDSWRIPDPDLPAKILAAVSDAVATGKLSVDTIDAAYQRVIRLKQKLVVK